MRPLLRLAILDDVLICLAFYTRLPVRPMRDGARAYGAAQWAAPLAGLVVGLIGALAYWLFLSLGLPPSPAALLAVGAGALTTGALHEDGLADAADGLGGGRTRERRLEIMRDSRIGTYGATALIFSFTLRAAFLAALAAPSLVLVGLIASHVSARALMPSFLQLVPPARSDGLAAGVGAVPANSAWLALAIGAAALLPLGHAGAVAAAGALLAAFVLVRRLALTALGGHTGDVLGALEQCAEIAVLAVASAVLV